MKELAYVNGKISTLADAKISILDRGFLYGDGCFESLRTFDGKPFLLPEHLHRLWHGLKILKIKPPVKIDALKIIVDQLITQSRLPNAYIKIIITRGAERPSLIIFVRPLPKSGRNKNKIVISRWIKPELPTSRLKTLNYLNNQLIGTEGALSDAGEVIQVASDGFVTEGTKSNIFIVKRGAIITPPTPLPILPGVIRAYVIKLARRLGHKVIENKFKVRELLQADEVFITNSLLDIQPITKVNKTVINRDTITQALIKNFWSLKV
ncbi:aminotransferase class IV [Candidatus Saganbacteria bacterium]|nr:aminotransferase class IV [Candidatus Saganbacteria bacterium]